MARILVAEDDGALRGLLTTVLSSAGHEVHAAADGAQALLAAKEFRPHLLLTDYIMPALDGLELVEAVWSLPGMAALPVIVFSAYAPDTRLRPFLETSKVRHVLKGRRLAHLVDEVDSLLSS